MLTPILWVVALLAVCDWLAVWRGWRRVRWVTKPGTLLALIIWFTTLCNWHHGLFWFGLALVFSLGGDIFLLLPERYFLFGLVSFFLAHVSYTVGLNLTPPPFRWEVVAAALVIISIAIAVGFRIVRKVMSRTDGSRLAPAVAAYIIVISLMVLSALLTLFKPQWPLRAALFCVVGAGLFWVSDTILGMDRFVRPFRLSPLAVMITYHTGQAMLAAGAVMAMTT